MDHSYAELHGYPPSTTSRQPARIQVLSAPETEWTVPTEVHPLKFISDKYSNPSTDLQKPGRNASLRYTEDFDFMEQIMQNSFFAGAEELSMNPYSLTNGNPILSLVDPLRNTRNGRSANTATTAGRNAENVGRNVEDPISIRRVQRPATQPSRFQVRIPAQTNEDDRRQIVRYVNAFAERMDRFIRAHERQHTTSFPDTSASMIYEQVNREIQPVTLSTPQCADFLRNISLDMVHAFIRHSNTRLQNMQDGNTSNRDNRITIFIIHEREGPSNGDRPNTTITTQRAGRQYVTSRARPFSNMPEAERGPGGIPDLHLNMSAMLRAAHQQEPNGTGSTNYLEWRNRMQLLRQRMDAQQDAFNSVRYSLPPQNVAADGQPRNSQELVTDLQRMLRRLRSLSENFEVSLHPTVVRQPEANSEQTRRNIRRRVLEEDIQRP